MTVADGPAVWLAEFRTDERLRAEFGSFESYRAWCERERPAAPATAAAAAAPLPADLTLEAIERRVANGDPKIRALLEASDARALLVERLLGDRSIALEFHGERQIVDAYLRSLLRAPAGRS